VLAGILALTAASEKVSFTKVIQRTPPLHWLDMLGRRPAAPAGSSAAGPPGGSPGTPGPAGTGPRSAGPATRQAAGPRTTASPP
jgi:UDP-GlcNAc:undecaprenyl-phosphate/decaprenyl-phosphate GlcNAc-1-phosphate transferase